MAFSIRTRLTFWYTALLTVSLILFAATFSYTLSKIFMSRIDRQVGSIANMMVHTVMNPRGEILLPADFEIILERFFGVRTAGSYIQVIDQHGNILGRSSNLSGANLPISPETYANAVNKATTFEVVPRFGSYSMRMVTKPIVFKEKGLVAIVQVGTSLEFMEEIFNSLIYIFTIGIGVAVLVAAAVGTFLARKALHPVAELTSAARRIEAESLNERIDIATPNDEIGMLSTTINEMIERLEKSFSQIKQFTADASHELKTPLTIMKGEVEIALRAKDDPEYLRETLESSLEEIDRMSDIVNNLLDLTKIEAERKATPTVPVRVDKVLTERFDAIKRVAAEKGVELVMESNSAALTVSGESVRIGQLLSNLIDNAVKYTPGGGKVSVSSASEDSCAVIRVKDTGVGIDKEDMPFIFDRFFRVDKARTGGVGGAGLGLSICSEIAESLKGEITLDSAIGVGSTFTLRLPLCDATA
ncbi:MAG: HAMP domain-containing histidine kinase [Proteobacteria bacterium]|nr:HAMP domain-containing histidine kinase [Pseudomonadota bacterium]